ncbi:MAG TPA: septum formation protein Maf [Desulfobulbaceae bacterium]|nr:septum formation protein Maf [Desulfobulbaceae bacterium]
MQTDVVTKSLLIQCQPLILASLSPRRQELLQDLGLEFSIVPAAVQEEAAKGESPADFVCRMAGDKANAVADHYGESWVLGADTIVVREDGMVLGKPCNTQEACIMLRSIAGRRHEVMTAYSLVNRSRAVFITRLEQAGVCLLPLSADMISAYVATGESMDKAGSYALQGIGGAFVASIDGAHSTVIGLPVHRVMADLLECGIAEVNTGE